MRTGMPAGRFGKGMPAGRFGPRADVLLAGALAAYSQLEIWWSPVAVGTGDVVGDKGVLVPTALLMTLPLALRRRLPLPALVLVVLGMAAQSVLTTPVEGLSTFASLLIAVYSVAAHAERRAALAGLAITLVGDLTATGDAADVVFQVVVTLAPWLAGRAMRSTRLRAAELERLTLALEREREEKARLAVLAERSRIARELHDVVAHSISVMVVQAGAVGRTLDPEHRRAREALISVERTGRQALAEMRRLLGVLRTEADQPLLAPPSGLAALTGLLDDVRAAGLAVELRVEGEPRPLAPGVDLSAFRIVQEALTNAIKHAGEARAWILVRYGRETLELVVEDDGRGPAGAAGGGHGLLGMRERVAIFGGELEAGARNGGGFCVRARLPLEPA